MNWAEIMLSWALACWLFGALMPLLCAKRRQAAERLAHGSALAGGVFGLIAALRVLMMGDMIDVTLWQMLPGIAWHLHVDALSAFFLVVICGLSAAIAVFSTGYVRKYAGRKNTAYLGSLLNAFILSMAAVVMVANSITFLVAWEVMSLVSFFLVMFEHEKLAVRTAGYIYLVMTHAATVFITLSFLVMFAYTGSVEFAVYQQQLSAMPGHLKSLIFLMCLLGFGTKAGLIPLHVWLPRAHPVAPSNISALMSAVMLKTAIYGLMRIVIDFLGGGPAWWGGLLLMVGVMSALIGILQALAENDAKRFLAYSSSENMGIIVAAFGSALLFQSYQQPALAALALTAALFHVFNHAWLKGLLFMGAGAVLFATHSKDIGQMGGLIKRMPWTAGLVLIGGLALAALPFSSGLASEWLVLQSMLHITFDLNNVWLQTGGAVAAALLALAGAFAGGGVVKQFGTAFLAMPRSSQAAQAVEVPLSMRWGMALAAAPVVAVGVMPGLVLVLTGGVTQRYFDWRLDGWLWMIEPFGGQQGSVFSIGMVVVVGLLLLGLGLLILRWQLGASRVRVESTWNCGGERLTPAMSYTASSYSHPVLMIFKQLLGLRHQTEVAGRLAYYPQDIRHSLHMYTNIETLLYRPLIAVMLRLAQQLRVVQNGNLQNYLAYMVAALIITLIWMR